MIVSIHRVSGVPHAAIMKLANAAKIRPIGRIVTRKGQDRQRHEQRTPPVIVRKVRALGQNADER